MLRPNTMQNTSSGTAAKMPSSGPASPSSRAPWPSWNTSTTTPSAASDGEEIERDRLQRHEHRFEPDRKGEQRPDHDEQHDSGVRRAIASA